ncbi:peptide ABC transporter ATP-binding protein [Paenibacillus sp. 32O-W]|jgi:ABC-type dipeptide/oligopeptide/nickel transport system, ATPase component|uniref:ATP-binding cassette domain-containing protein n=1 Tax=Paenibacillus sp. 32O-W TaxID=1695218 RepID=UPI000722CABB|nr:ABC transporter ATP-binding protein [Paenibacillus sp. 32O-W]ALS26232.1 peptide ABC transporter ATP-binding protein [Paenibacillus sp. 32O-W]
MGTEQTNPLLRVENLSIGFSQYVKGTKKRLIHPISDLNVDICEGEIVAVVGASGSGKSLLAHAVLGILPGNAICGGRIVYRGEPLTEERKARLRGREISFIPQSVNFLDPLMRVGKQVQIGLEKSSAKQAQQALFEQYGLKVSDGKLFPHELSGGMLRRVLFATSVRDGVRLVIADEPTPGIHPEALAEILKQLKQFAKDGAGVMLITHDLISALEIANRVAVIEDGRTVEISEAADFEGRGERLKTEYTQRLWRALPQNDFDLEFQEKEVVHIAADRRESGVLLSKGSLDF